MCVVWHSILVKGNQMQKLKAIFVNRFVFEFPVSRELQVKQRRDDASASVPVPVSVSASSFGFKLSHKLVQHENDKLGNRLKPKHKHT